MSHIRKLIEVALPLDAINAESAREKSIRHGHPSTLHLWWARRPLAAARAVLWASLVDDPSSHPELFPSEEEQEKERQRLHALLAQLVKWENSNNEEILEAARAEIRKHMGDEPLVFLDPFAGGGSIPLEAQRLGLEAHAHDLNPVAVMINKAMIEIPPKFAGQPPVNPEVRKRLGNDRSWSGASGLAEDVRYYGEWMKQEAFRRIGHLYPRVKLPPEQGGGETTVIAWIWVRTVKCPNPACGCEMPLASSFVLSKKKGKEAWVEPVIDGKDISYTVHSNKCPKDKETNKLGKGATFRCPVCGATTEKKYIHDAFVAKANNAVLMAVVAEGKNGRIYLSPTSEQMTIAKSAVPEWEPEEEMNTKCTDLVSGRGYGITHWNQLFTPRQLTALTTFSDLVAEAQQKAILDAVTTGMADDGIGLADGGCGATAYGQAVGVYLAFSIDKMVDYHSTICIWHTTRDLVANTMRRQAIQMTWDYAEANPFSNSSGCFDNMLTWIGKYILTIPGIGKGMVDQHDAQTDYGLHNIIISSDPPYYDNIGYADLSDFFYIWMRCSLKNTYPRLFRTMLVPKAEELVATPYRFEGSKEKARNFFEHGMQEACRQFYTSAREDVPVTIYYAYKQSETDQGEAANQASTGWETMLSAAIKAGFTITGTWPMRTELTTALKGNINALASSIVLVCRKRPQNAPSCARRGFLAELKKELRSALKNLQASNIAPVDMAQAAIGPGMGVYSRYAKVLEADGSAMSVRSALHIINQELDAYFTDQDGELDADSRFCLDLYSQYAFNDMRFGEADVLARAKNTSVDKLKDMGLVHAEKGIVRLVPRDELPDFAKRRSLASKCVWLLTQYLTLAMEENGVSGCAAIMLDFPSEAERARDLAYRLFSLAERKSWNSEAYAYNSLVVAWAEIQQQAGDMREARSHATQGTLFQP